MAHPHELEVEVFEAALERPPGQRQAFLEQASAGHPELLERVRALLHAAENGADFLATIQSNLAPSHPAIEKPGDHIGRYKLLEQIGEGGCGIVYKAAQEEPIRRHVALKVIKLGMDTRQVIARFEAERQALALMDHPNIAKVHDAGATATGRPFFVMELVRGLRITEYCNDKRLPTRKRLELFIQVCQAVQHAHQKGIIHRDLKPSNILVTVNDGVAVPKVIDFGIAKATSGERLTDKTIFTEAAKSVQIARYLEDMLRGIDPKIAQERDTMLLQQALTQTAARVSRDLTNQPLVEAHLKSTIGNIFAALGEFQNAELMARNAVALRRSDPASQPAELAESLYDLAHHLWSQGKLAEAEQSAREGLSLATNSAAKKSALVANSLAQLGVIVQDQGRLAEAEGLFRESLAIRKQLVGNEHPAVAQALNTLSGVLTLEGKVVEADKANREALKVFGWAHGDPSDGDLLYSRGDIFFEQASLAEAETCFRQALAIRRKLPGQHNPGGAACVTFDMTLVAVAGKCWEETTEGELLANRALIPGRHSPRRLLVLGHNRPDTYMFRTGEGTLGMLRIVGLSQHGRGVQIRYKLINPTKSFSVAP